MTSDSQSIADTSLTPSPATSTGSASPIAHPHVDAPRLPATRATWIKRVAAVLGILLVTAGVAAYGAWASWVRSGNIASGIYIAGEPVGGLVRKDAKVRLQKRFGRLFVEVKTPGHKYAVSVRQLGGQMKIDSMVDKAYRYGRDGSLLTNVLHVWQTRETAHRMTLPIIWNKAHLRRTMWNIATSYNLKPKNAGLRVGPGGTEVVPGEDGRNLNVGATLAKLQKMYYVGLPSIEAVTHSVSPRITAASLEGVDMRFGHYNTSYDSGLEGRTRNIHVAAEAIDGVILMPGETFSFNRKTGERTWDKGYRMAHIFERKPGKDKSEVVDGLAGGVCQVSSTLFNAVRKSNKNTGKHLKIVERNTHSLPVTYVPSGLDATVAWPGKDFRFRNSFAYPIYLRATAERSHLAIGVWARVPHHIAASMAPPDAPPVVKTPALAKAAIPAQAAPERHAENF